MDARIEPKLHLRTNPVIGQEEEFEYVAQKGDEFASTNSIKHNMMGAKQALAERECTAKLLAE